MEVKGLTERSRRKLAEALEIFISVNNVRALLTVGELGRCKEVHDMVLAEIQQGIQRCRV